MGQKRGVKKEYLWVFIALIMTSFIRLPRLEFLIYQNLKLLLTILITSLAVLITFYLTKNVAHRIVNKLSVSLKKLWSYTEELCSSSLILVIKYLLAAWKNFKLLLKKLAVGAKETFNLKRALPKKELFIESLKTTQQTIKRKNFKYKMIGAASLNLFVGLYLIKGLKPETNSINVLDSLEIKFLTYKALLLTSQKLALPALIALEYLRLALEQVTLQNVLLTVSATSIVYILSKKKFRDKIRSILLKSYTITEEKVSEKSKMLQKGTKDLVNKRSWQQIREEANLFGKELRDELNSKEAKKRLLLITLISIVTIILISGSIDIENNMWTSFVAASAGQSCNGTQDVVAGTYLKCDASETCCAADGSACSTAPLNNYYCWNASALDDTDSSNNLYDYDQNASTCISAIGGTTVNSWWCNGASPGTACTSGTYGTKTNFGTTWYWGFSTTMGYETNTQGQCCGDDTYGGSQEFNLSCSSDAGIAFSGTCDTTDIACCAGNAHCVDPDVFGLIGMGLNSYCYNAGGAYNVSGSTGDDSYAYCSPANKWYDCDLDGVTCTGDNSTTSPGGNCSGIADWPRQGTGGGNRSWIWGGESGAFGEYDSGTAIECCGDDTNEWYRTSEGDSADSSKACCDTTNDCVLSNTCKADTQCYGTTPDLYCDAGTWSDPDDVGASAHCEACGYVYYSGYSGGSGEYCCGDDGTGDDFYYINPGGSPDVCQYCSDGTDNSENCLGDNNCAANGVLLNIDNVTACTQGPNCWCRYGESCDETGYTGHTNMTSCVGYNQVTGACDGLGIFSGNCSSGGIYNDTNANCFSDGPGPDLNGTCRFLHDADPCTSAGLTYSVSTACADEGNESADGWYCYYDEGCTTTGPNPGCTDGERRPECDVGGMSGSGANCEMRNSQPGGVDVCAYNGADACAADNNGWDYTNDTLDGWGTTCTTCDLDYQLNTSSNECHFGMECTDGGWAEATNESCYEWCWANDLDSTTGCFGSLTLINRTEPANATGCYSNRGCSATGCTWDSPTMRQDYCDQCEPTGATQATDYCPTINATCTSNCANSGTIWYNATSSHIDRCSNTNTTCLLDTDTLTIGDVWGGNGSAAFCDNTECHSDCTAAGKGGGTCDAGTCVCASPECDQGCMFVRNSTEQNVTIFTYTGNMFITGSLLSAIGVPDGSDFIIRDSANANQAWINDVNGSLGLAGLVYQNMAAYCAPAGSSYVIRDKSENCVAYINSTGDLWLRGNLTQNAVINP